MPLTKNVLTYTGLKSPIIFAHRGSSVYAPENTMAAFTLAVQQQADAVELDVKLSADGQVVVMHDETVDRTTDGTGWVNALTLTELKRLDAGSKFNLAYHSEKIPTLAEVFEAVGNKIIINVELKNFASPIDDLPDKVVSLIKKHGLERSVILSSFNPIALIRARFLLPKVPMGLLTISGLGNVTLRSRLVRFGPLLALHSAYGDVSSELVFAAHKLRTRINAFTVNQPEIMQRLFELGVDGIFTDDPLLAQKVLSEIKAK
jgi:glycerophosphoryl diester phosphodiesterase